MDINKFDYINSEELKNLNLSATERTTLIELIEDAKNKNYKIDYFTLKELFNKSKLSFIIEYLIDNDLYDESYLIDDDIDNDIDTIDFDTFEDLDINIDSSDLFKIYINDIGRYSLLTADEEVELFIKYNNGDNSAKKTLINHNLRLVISIANRYKHSGLDFMDIIQLGNLGLMKAVDKFKVNLGNRFSTYATWWIKQSIIRGITNDSRAIRLPVHAVEHGQKIHKAIECLKNENDKEPSTQEIADYINKTSPSSKEFMTVDKVKVYMNFYNLGSVISLETPIRQDEDESSCLGDFIASDDKNPEDTAVENDMTKFINEIIEQCLTTRQADVLYYRFGLNGRPVLTLEQIGNLYDVSRERIRQIEFKALNRLKKNLRVRRALKNYIQ